MASFDSSSLIGKKMTSVKFFAMPVFFFVTITKVGIKLFDEKNFEEFKYIKASVKTCYFRIGI